MIESVLHTVYVYHFVLQTALGNLIGNFLYKAIHLF